MYRSGAMTCTGQRNNTPHRTQDTEHIEETLSNTASISGAGRPAAHSFGRECAAGLFSFKSVFVAHTGSVPGGNKNSDRMILK